MSSLRHASAHAVQTCAHSKGACRPELAHQALEADPSIAALLPCNVVVRAVDPTTTVVEAFDPDAMMSIAAHDQARDSLSPVATDSRQRLTATLAALENC